MARKKVKKEYKKESKKKLVLKGGQGSKIIRAKKKVGKGKCINRVRKKPTKAQKRLRKLSKPKEDKDYGKPPAGVKTYSPIRKFDPENPPEYFIIVKMSRFLIDELSRNIDEKGAREIGFPCEEV